MALEAALHGCLLYTNPFRPVQGVLRARAGRRFFDVHALFFSSPLDKPRYFSGVEEDASHDD